MHELTRYSVPELRNYFTVKEAAALCDMENGALHTVSIIPRRALIGSFEDVCEFDMIDKK